MDYIKGINSIAEAFESGKTIERLIVAREARNPRVYELEKMARQNNIEVKMLPEAAIMRLAGPQNQGVAALVSPVAYANFEIVVQSLFEEGKMPALALLDGITDVRNFGAIARSALAAGIHALLLPQKNSVTVTSDAVRISSGALLKIPVCKVSSVGAAIKYLQQSGFATMALSELGAKSLYQTDLTGPTLFVLGAEDTGPSEAALKTCEAFVKIPMAGNIDSLNVSVSAGIVFFEMLRQRLTN